MRYLTIVVFILSLYSAGCSHALVGSADVSQQDATTEQSEVRTPQRTVRLTVNKARPEKDARSPDANQPVDWSSTRYRVTRNANGRLIIRRVEE